MKQPMKKMITAAAAASAVIALAAPSSAGPPTTVSASVKGAPASTQAAALTWTPTYMAPTHNYSQAEAVALARTYDVVAGMPKAFHDHVAAMRAANPRLTLLSYANATFSDAASLQGVSEDQYAHDTAGRRITSRDFGNFLMEPSNPLWRARAVSVCDARVAASGYDGCLLDMLTMGIFNHGYLSSLPASPATHRTYTEGDWREQVVTLSRQYQAVSPHLIHVGNAISNSRRYWHSAVSSRPIAVNLPGAMMEDFLRGAADPVSRFPKADDWLDNVKVVTDMEASGHSAFYSTKLWSGATPEQAAAWQSYSMASFLMGANGHSYFAFTSSRDQAGATGTSSAYTMPRQIGMPTGSMVAVGRAYQRRFDRGLSVVNPSSTPETVALDGYYRTLSGQTVSSVTLGAHTGDVLLRTADFRDETPPTGAVSSPGPRAELGRAAVLASGTAQDDRATGGATVAVRNQATGLWLKADGSYSPFAQRLPVTLSNPGGRQTAWSTTLDLAPGSYGMALVVTDASGNVSAAPRPWTVFTVG